MKLDELLAQLKAEGKRALIGFPGALGLIRSDMAGQQIQTVRSGKTYAYRIIAEYGHRDDWRVYTDDEPRPWFDEYVPQEKP